MPPMNPEPPMSPEPPMDMDDEMDGNMGMDNTNDFDNESNPEKKEIQRISGELSQKVNDYNSNNEKDSELNKYVLGMIIKQASKGLSDDDKQELADKLSNGETDDDEDNNPHMEDDNDDSQSMDENPDDKMMESKIYLDEIIDDLVNKNDRNRENKLDNKSNNRFNPFISRR